MPRLGARIRKYFFTTSVATLLLVVVVGWYHLLSKMDDVAVRTSHGVGLLTPVSTYGFAGQPPSQEKAKPSLINSSVSKMFSQ